MLIRPEEKEQGMELKQRWIVTAVFLGLAALFIVAGCGADGDILGGQPVEESDEVDNGDGAASSSVAFVFSDIQRSGDSGDNLFIAINEAGGGSIDPQITVGSDSYTLHAQSEGMSNFITYFDPVTLESKETLRTTIDFQVTGNLVTHNFPLAFGVYHSNPDPDEPYQNNWLTEDNIANVNEVFENYDGYAMTFKPSEEPGEEETQRFHIRRAGVGGSSTNKFMDQNAQGTFGFDDVDLSLSGPLRVIIDIRYMSEDTTYVTVALAPEGSGASFYTFSFDTSDFSYLDPFVTFDAIGYRFGTAGDTDIATLTINDLQVESIPEP